MVLHNAFFSSAVASFCAHPQSALSPKRTGDYISDSYSCTDDDSVLQRMLWKLPVNCTLSESSVVPVFVEEKV